MAYYVRRRTLEDFILSSAYFDIFPKFSEVVKNSGCPNTGASEPCIYTISEEYDGEGSDVNLLSVDLKIPNYECTVLPTLVAELVEERFPDVKSATDYRSQLGIWAGRLAENLFGTIYGNCVDELYYYRDELRSTFNIDIGGKFKEAITEVVSGEECDKSKSFPYKSESHPIDGDDNFWWVKMRIVSNPIHVDILGLKNRDEIDKARSIIKKIMASHGAVKK